MALPLKKLFSLEDKEFNVTKTGVKMRSHSNNETISVCSPYRKRMSRINVEYFSVLNMFEGVRGEVINDFPQKQNFYLESFDWWVTELTCMYKFYFLHTYT